MKRISSFIALLFITFAVSFDLQAQSLARDAFFSAAKQVQSVQKEIAPGVTQQITRYEKDGFKYPLIELREESKILADGSKKITARRESVANHMIVRLQPGASKAQLLALCNQKGYTLLKDFGIADLYLIEFPVGQLGQLDSELQNVSSEAIIRNASSNNLCWLLAVPDDPQYDKQWDMDIIDAPEAWDHHTDSSSVKVAVIDSGIDYEHEDLKDNMNDENLPDPEGAGPETLGYNFVNSDDDPMDDNGHGTHCAGTIAAFGNNAKGIAGINWRAKLVALKVLNAAGSGTWDDFISAVAYCHNNNIRFANVSLGGYGFAQTVYDAIDAAPNTLFICAASNDALDNDVSFAYPASYDLPNIISVMATGPGDVPASYTNFGLRSVHIAAPGGDGLGGTGGIYSTVPSDVDSPNGGYEYYSGTSMAAPHVAGACTWLGARFNSLSNAQIKAKIIGTADKKLEVLGYCASEARLNLNNLRSTNEFIRILRPIGTDAYKTTDTMSIRWVSSAGGTATIKLYKSGIENRTIATGIVNGSVNEYSWDMSTESFDEDGDYQVQIYKSSNTGINDISYSYFSIDDTYPSAAQAYLTLITTPGAGGTTDPAKKASVHLVNIGENIDIEAIANATYDFESWYSTPYGTINDTDAAVTKVKLSTDDAGDGRNVTCVAEFSRDISGLVPLEIFCSRHTWGNTNPRKSHPDNPVRHYVDPGVAQAITATPAVIPPHTYLFNRWGVLSGDAVIADVNSANTTVTLNSGSRIAAYFVRDTGFLYVLRTTGGDVDPAGRIVVDYGDATAITATVTNPDYEFINWIASGDVTVDDYAAAATNATLNSRDATVRANFQRIGSLARLDMKVSPSKGGTTAPAVGRTMLAPGTVQAINAVPNAGYEFSHWSVDWESNGEIANTAVTPTNVTVNWHCRVTAHFNRTATLTVAQEANGAAAAALGGGGVIPVNEWSAITCAPAGGTSFLYWIADRGATIEDPSSANTNVKISRDATVTAVLSTDLNMTDISLGSIFTLDAATIQAVDGTFPATFSRRPAIYASRYDSDRSRWYSTPATPYLLGGGDTTWFAYWRGIIRLFDYRDFLVDQRGGTDAATWIAGNPIGTQDYVFRVRTIENGNRYDTVVDQGVTLQPPTITSVENRDGAALASIHQGGIFIVKGTYFGSAPPLVWLEFTRPDGRISQLRCRVIRPYRFRDHNGTAGKSCMDVTNSEGGGSEISEIWCKVTNRIPGYWDHAEAHNIVLYNRIGLASAVFATHADTTNTAPVARNDAFAGIAVDSRNNELDIFADNGSGADVDADGDDFRPILGTPDSGGIVRWHASKRVVLYTPAPGFTGIETFDYILDDRTGQPNAYSGTATVTVNVP